MLRIWDCLMLEGPKILFRVALGVIFFFESQLAKMQSLEQVMGSLKGKLALLVSNTSCLGEQPKLHGMRHAVADSYR